MGDIDQRLKREKSDNEDKGWQWGFNWTHPARHTWVTPPNHCQMHPSCSLPSNSPELSWHFPLLINFKMTQCTNAFSLLKL
jgi:hypothetical protein